MFQPATPTRRLLLLFLLILMTVPISVEAQQRRAGKLKAGDAAIDFTLRDAHGTQTVQLAELKGKPVVLIFGSSTSSRFVESVAAINKLYTAYEDAAHVYVVYVRENPGKKDDDDAPAPKTFEERRQVASAFAKRVGLLAPVLMDTEDDQTDNLYAGWPDRIYVIDAHGNVLLKSNYTLDGFGPALSAIPFLLYKHTEGTFAELPAPTQESTRPKQRSRRPREVRAGDAAPDFTLQDTQGETTVKLSELRGKPVVLIFGSCT